MIGSTSKRKIEIAEKVLKELFDDEVSVEGFKASSGVSETPFDTETFDGAKNRAMQSREASPDAAYWLGVESGLVERYGHMYEEAWCVAISSSGEEFYGYSSGLKVPDIILNKMDELKLEHFHVMEMLEKEYALTDSDTWGNYSGGVLSREVSLEEAIRNAFVQIVAPEKSLYKK
jgi:non-canonical (house-cleaning) NTP pyrophosphatase